MDDILEKTPAEIIRNNIDSANILLDIALSKVMDKQDVPAKMIESIAKLVDSITTAANSLITAEENIWGLQLKAEMVKLKEREIDLKSLVGQSKPTQQNIFVGSFGDLLKQINTPAARVIEE